MATLLDEKMLILLDKLQENVQLEVKDITFSEDSFTFTDCGAIGCSGFCGSSCSRHCGGKCSSVVQ